MLPATGLLSIRLSCTGFSDYFSSTRIDAFLFSLVYFLKAFLILSCRNTGVSSSWTIPFRKSMYSFPYKIFRLLPSFPVFKKSSLIALLLSFNIFKGTYCSGRNLNTSSALKYSNFTNFTPILITANNTTLEHEPLDRQFIQRHQLRVRVNREPFTPYP